MHDYLLSSEWIRFAFVLGIAVSMVMYEKRHLTTGSIVVPGYIAVFTIHPLVILATFLNALATYAFVNLFLRRYVLLYGRTKFTILAVTSTAIQTVMLRVTPSGPWLWESDVPLFIAVGYIVPALIAHDMARQGIRKTTTSVLVAGVIVAVPIALAIGFDLPGVNELAPISGYGDLAIDSRWLPIAVALAVVGSWAVAHNYGWRSGGFVGAAFTGMFMGDPWQVAVAFGIAVVTWLLVTRVLMRQMILFGRRKFSSMLLVSSMLAWSSLWVGDRFFDVSWQEHFGVGSLALTPLLLPGLLANDAQRTSPRRVATGLLLACGFVVSTTWWIQSVVDGGILHPGWKVLSACSAIVLFAPQLDALARRLLPLDQIRELGLRLQTARRALPAVELAAVDATMSIERPSAAGWMLPWEAWRDHHPEAADAAERWLDEQLASAGAPERRIPADTSYLDVTTASVVEATLRAERGFRSVPRRRRGEALATMTERTPFPDPVGPPDRTDPSSGTSDTGREAHTPVSDVPGEPATAAAVAARARPDP